MAPFSVLVAQHLRIKYLTVVPTQFLFHICTWKFLDRRAMCARLTKTYVAVQRCQAARCRPSFPPRSASTDVTSLPSITPPLPYDLEQESLPTRVTALSQLKPLARYQILKMPQAHWISLPAEPVNPFEPDVWSTGGLATPLSSNPDAVHQPRASELQLNSC